jgi:probable HAF family extracellular repeat protein
MRFEAADRSRSCPAFSALGSVAASLLFLLVACGSGVESAGSKAYSTSAPTASSRLPAQYAFQFFDPVGSQRTIADGINDVGVVTGEYLSADWFPGCGCGRHGFVRTPNGSLTTFDPDGSISTRALGINNAGVIVGYYGDGSHAQGFIRTPDGKFTQQDFPSPPAFESGLTDINNRGDIVGGYDTGDVATSINYVLQHGRYTVMPDAPGSAPLLTFASGINDLGWLTGYFQDTAGNDHGFLFINGVYRIVDDPRPSNVNTLLYKTNDVGIAVGISDIGSFVLDTRTNTFSTLSCPGGFYGEPRAINNRGQIVGACRTEANGPFHGFIATPVTPDE